MKQTFTFICTPETTDTRLDMFLIEQLKVSRSQVQKYILNGLVLVNGKKPKKSGDRLRRDSTITVDLENEGEHVLKKDETASTRPVADYGVRVIAETSDYLIVHKPAGLLVHPTEANEQESLTRWLVERYPETQGVGESPVRPGIVHRIDKDASGLLVVARNQAMFDFLKTQFKARTVEKIYSVLVHEVVAADHDIISFAIDRGKGGRMVARPAIDLTKVKNVGKEQPGKSAVTEFWVEKRFTRFTLLKVKIHTGRMHQIRVHALAYNHPVVGDRLYFNKKLNLKRDRRLGRLFLHAKQLCFDDLAGKRICADSTLPDELKNFLQTLN